MVWDHFDGSALALHIVSVFIVGALVLLADYALSPHNRGRTLALVVFTSVLVGALVYAGWFDSGLLYPFDWKSIGFIVGGGAFVALSCKYINDPYW